MISKLIDSPLWVEKYRPTTVDACVLSSTMKKVFKGIISTKTIPHLLLAGGQGMGKTTLAKALCSELEYEYLFINASEERGIDTLRSKVSSYASALSFEGGRKAIILDEADQLTPDAQAALRSIMEQYTRNCAFILTCNFKEKIIKPIHSRCAVHDFKITREEKQEVLAPLLKRLKFILDSERVEYDVKVLSAVIVKFFPDYRRIINQLQNFSQINGKIDEGILTLVSEINITKLCQALKEKKFNVVREWVVENLDSDPQRIYRKIYDNLKDFLKQESIPQAILLLHDFQYKSAFSADQEIALLAFLIAIMMECEFI